MTKRDYLCHLINTKKKSYDHSNLVYLECPDGKYGQNCRYHCNIHCMIKGKCDKKTGHCTGGCQPGWENNKCDIGNVYTYSNLRNYSVLQTFITYFIDKT